MTARRVLAAAGLALALVVSGFAGTAMATEAGLEVPDYSELAGNEVAAEFLPEPYEGPEFFADWWVVPLLAVGVLVAAYVLLRYLVWQPRFAREREEKQRSRR